MGARLIDKNNNNMKTTEEKVSNVVLQKEVEIRLQTGKVLKVKQPTLATLIEASALVSKMPKEVLENGKRLGIEALRIAKECEVIADILAVMVCGSSKKTKVLQRIRRRMLREKFMYSYQPVELQELLKNVLGDLQLVDFFVLTVSLQEVNVTKPTETETAQSGQ